MRAHRPPVETEHSRLVLAGDWVALPVPAALMEAAVTSGLVAANAILRHEGVREEPVYSVPPRGLLARSSSSWKIRAATTSAVPQSPEIMRSQP
jgi:isorenieratene synthase